MNRVLLALAVAGAVSFSSEAVADVNVGVRVGVGGGLGDASRPVYGGLAGFDASVKLGRNWGLGVSTERTITERPNDDRKVDREMQASLSAVWFSQQRSRANRVSGQIAIGAGYRSYRRSSNDPLLGDVAVRGITLIHLRSILEWPITDRVSLGVAFDWNFGIYTSQSYIDPSAFISKTESAPPELKQDPELTNIYSVGPRVSFAWH